MKGNLWNPNKNKNNNTEFNNNESDLILSYLGDVVRRDRM